jgi:hypothetical protein
MKYDEFRIAITNPDFTEQDIQALLDYAGKIGYDAEEWEVFIAEINSDEWEINGEKPDDDDDSDVEFIQVSEDRYLIRIA